VASLQARPGQAGDSRRVESGTVAPSLSLLALLTSRTSRNKPQGGGSPQGDGAASALVLPGAQTGRGPLRGEVGIPDRQKQRSKRQGHPSPWSELSVLMLLLLGAGR